MSGKTGPKQQHGSGPGSGSSRETRRNYGVGRNTEETAKRQRMDAGRTGGEIIRITAGFVQMGSRRVGAGSGYCTAALQGIWRNAKRFADGEDQDRAEPFRRGRAKDGKRTAQFRENPCMCRPFDGRNFCSWHAGSGNPQFRASGVLCNYAGRRGMGAGLYWTGWIFKDASPGMVVCALSCFAVWGNCSGVLSAPADPLQTTVVRKNIRGETPEGNKERERLRLKKLVYVLMEHKKTLFVFRKGFYKKLVSLYGTGNFA